MGLRSVMSSRESPGKNNQDTSSLHQALRMAEHLRPVGKGQGASKRYVPLELSHPGTRGCGRLSGPYARLLHFGGTFQTENNTYAKRPYLQEEHLYKWTNEGFSIKDGGKLASSSLSLMSEHNRSFDHTTSYVSRNTTHASLRFGKKQHNKFFTPPVSALLTLGRIKGQDGKSLTTEFNPEQITLDEDQTMLDFTVEGTRRGRSSIVEAAPTHPTIEILQNPFFLLTRKDNVAQTQKPSSQSLSTTPKTTLKRSCNSSLTNLCINPNISAKSK